MPGPRACGSLRLDAGAFSTSSRTAGISAFTRADELLGRAGDDLEAGPVRLLARLRALEGGAAFAHQEREISGGVPAGANSALNVSETKPG